MTVEEQMLNYVVKLLERDLKIASEIGNAKTIKILGISKPTIRSYDGTIIGKVDD